MITLETLATWMTAPTETEHLELKEARNQFDTAKLVNYCYALANECGGHLVLGVTDRWPRRVPMCQRGELCQVLPNISTRQVQNLFRDLRRMEPREPKGRRAQAGGSLRRTLPATQFSYAMFA